MRDASFEIYASESLAANFFLVKHVVPHLFKNLIINLFENHLNGLPKI